MRLYPDNLHYQLQKNSASLYVLYGNEPFLIEENANLIRQMIKASPTIEHEMVIIDNTTNADWHNLIQSTQHYSLFTQKRFIDIRISSKMTPPVAQHLAALLQAQSQDLDLIILLQIEQLTKSQQSAAWFTLAEQKGIVIAHWPLTPAQFLKWLDQKAKQRKLLLAPAALQLLVSYTEGNCLAAAEEIDRLALYYLHQKEPITTLLVDDQNQFDVFSLCEAALLQQNARTLKILNCFKNAQTVPPQLILWALAQTLRALLRCALVPSEEAAQRTILQRAGIRIAVHNAYLTVVKKDLSATWSLLLGRLSLADKALKSGELDTLWRNMIEISLGLGGLLIPQLF